MSPTFPSFDLTRLLRTVFVPIRDLRVCILIDLERPEEIRDLKFLEDPANSIQRLAYEVFHQGLHNGVMQELGHTGGELFAYKRTGGSNLDLPEQGFDEAGNEISLIEAVYKVYDLILCISTDSATAPLTVHAKEYGFRGATMHEMNEVIISSGLCVDYNEVSREAELLRSGMTKADSVEIDFEFLEGRTSSLKLLLDQQEAQKSQGLCHGIEPDIANLPAGEVYFVPTGAEGEFPLKHSDGTMTLNKVRGGRIVDAELLSGNQATMDAFLDRIKRDPMCGLLGELGFGTQELPFSNADIQDEKVRGTVHVATGRSDHLGGSLTPDQFEDAGNATHDDLLFHPEKTPEINVTQVRMYWPDRQEVLIENYRPSAYMTGLLTPGS